MKNGPEMPRVMTSGRVVATAVLLLGIGQQAAGAVPDQSPDAVEGISVCPDPRAVWLALSALFGPEKLERRLRTLPDTGGPRVTVADLGTAFRVHAGGQSREYRDESRDCANRARLAALFVALTIDSVEQTAVAKGGSSLPVPAVVRAPVNGPVDVPPRRHIVHLEMGVDGQLGVGPSTVAPGGLIRMTWGTGRFVMLGGLRATIPMDGTMAGVRVRQWRAAVDVAARVRWSEDRPVSPFAELGLVTARLFARAPALATSDERAGNELGVLAGAGMSFRRRTWGAAFLLLEAEIDPDPPTFSALPIGSLGRTPYVWLRAAAGLSLGAR